VPNFVSVAPSIAELADGEKSRTQSLGLYDLPGIEPFTVKQLCTHQKVTEMHLINDQNLTLTCVIFGSSKHYATLRGLREESLPVDSASQTFSQIFGSKYG